MASIKSTNTGVLTVGFLVLLGLTMCCASRTQLSSLEAGGIYKEDSAEGSGSFDGSGRGSGFAQGPNAKSSGSGSGSGRGSGSGSIGDSSAGGSGSGTASGSGFGNTGKSGGTSSGSGNGYTYGGGSGLVFNGPAPPPPYYYNFFDTPDVVEHVSEPAVAPAAGPTAK